MKNSKSIFALSALVIAADVVSVMDIGKELQDSNFDELTTGGFWIWHIESDVEYYSDKFRSVLGFNGEEDFPSTVKSWQDHILPEDKKIAFDNFDKSLANPKDDPYDQEVTYRCKNGTFVHIRCSGRLITGKAGDRYLVGTHKILEDGRNKQ